MVIHSYKIVNAAQGNPPRVESGVRSFSKGNSPVSRVYEGIHKDSDGQRRIKLRVNGVGYSFTDTALIEAMGHPNNGADETALFKVDSDNGPMEVCLSLESAKYIHDRLTGNFTPLLHELGFENAGYGHWCEGFER